MDKKVSEIAFIMQDRQFLTSALNNNRRKRKMLFLAYRIIGEHNEEELQRLMKDVPAKSENSNFTEKELYSFFMKDSVCKQKAQKNRWKCWEDVFKEVKRLRLMEPM